MGRHSAPPPPVRNLHYKVSLRLFIAVSAATLALLSGTIAVAKSVAPVVRSAQAPRPPAEPPIEPPSDFEVIQYLVDTVSTRSAREIEQVVAVESQAAAELQAAEQVAAEAAAVEQAAVEARAVAEAEQADVVEPEPIEEVATEVGEPPVAAGVATISNSAGPVSVRAQAAADAVVSNVPGAAGITIGGTRASAVDPGGHPSGNALDYMVGGDSALGDAIVAYHIANWSSLGVDYIIWQQQYLSSPNGAWEWMEDRGSATANHYDHPHVNYLP